MPALDLYSKRQKKLRGDVPDVYVYDELPEGFRVQVVHILREALGFQGEDEGYSSVTRVVNTILGALRKEYGVFQLSPGRGNSRFASSEIINFFLQEYDTEKCIDVIEICFKFIDRFARSYDYLMRSRYNEIADDAIFELNARFKEHGIGFQYIDGEVFRIDSEFIHSEAVKPALNLLNTKDFSGAQEEFLSAFEHFRHGNNKEALNDCLKCFESTMKAICTKRNWTFKPGDSAKNLIDICLQNGLVPPFWQTQLSSLRSLLESGIPTGRNRLSAHGQGATPSVVPDYIVAYMLHMTASTVVFLTTADRDLP